MSSFSTTSLASGSGLDVQSTVDQLIYTERAPERLMQQQQSKLDAQKAAMRNIQSNFSDLEQSVYALKDASGALTSRSVESTAPDVLTGTADASAASGTHTVVVQSLATTSSYYTKSITDSDFVFASGSTMTVQVGTGAATNLTFDGKTLQQAADYMNGLSLGIKAGTITDSAGTRLAIVSTSSGVPGAINITNDRTQASWQTSSPGQNAELLVDGVPVQSATNSISDVIPGLKLTFSGTTANAVQLTVGPDTGKAKQAITEFVDSYNAVISAINAQFKVDPYTNSAGVLASDSTLRSLQSTLLSSMSYSVGGNSGAETLRSVGIEMQDDGTLKVNASVLENVLSTRYGCFQKFFQGTSGGGFGNMLDSVLTDVNDSVQGPIALDLKGMTSTRDSISDQIDDFEVRIQTRQQQLYDEYTRIDVMLRQMSSLQSQVSSQLASLETK